MIRSVASSGDITLINYLFLRLGQKLSRRKKDVTNDRTLRKKEDSKWVRNGSSSEQLKSIIRRKQNTLHAMLKLPRKGLTLLNQSWNSFEIGRWLEWGVVYTYWDIRSINFFRCLYFPSLNWKLEEKNSLIKVIQDMYKLEQLTEEKKREKIMVIQDM